jgi:Sulfotransferase domain
MWAHPRAVSTAFGRMMIERGDVTVVHEPLVTLADEGEVRIPAPDGETVVARSTGAVLDGLTRLARDRRVFCKDTLEYRYQDLFDRPAEIAGMTHTFIVRHPARAISSHYAVKPTVTCPEIGYEHQYDLFELVRTATGRTPLVIRAEHLIEDPAAVVEAFCAAVRLPFLPHALTWRAGERPEWQRTRKWHLDAIASTGFSEPAKNFQANVENNAKLSSFYDYHLPFYQLMVQHAI